MATGGSDVVAEISETLLSCEICKELFDSVSRTPRILSCFHSFCKVCTDRLTRNASVRCPKCRRRTTVTGEVSLDFTRMALIDLVRSARSHDSAAAQSCPEHPGETLKLFCVQCKKAVCAICGLTRHQEGHGLRELAAEVEDRRTEVLSLCDQLDSVAPALQTKLEQAETNLKLADANVSQAERELQSAIAQIVCTATARQDEALQELKAQAKADRSILEEQAVVLQSLLSAARAATHYGRSIVSQGLATLVVEKSSEIKKILTDLDEKMTSRVLPAPTYQVDTRKLEEVATLIRQLGKTVAVDETRKVLYPAVQLDAERCHPECSVSPDGLTLKNEPRLAQVATTLSRVSFRGTCATRALPTQSCYWQAKLTANPIPEIKEGRGLCCVGVTSQEAMPKEDNGFFNYDFGAFTAWLYVEKGSVVVEAKCGAAEDVFQTDLGPYAPGSPVERRVGFLLDFPRQHIFLVDADSCRVLWGGRMDMEKRLWPVFQLFYSPPAIGASICLSVPAGEQAGSPSAQINLLQQTLERFTAPLKLDAMRGERWIVVTSISLPTADLKFLASLPGWHVVVAGDAKTPDPWQYPNCVFLGLKRQRNLGLETVGLLPEGSYSRKNAGFLYAIAHGAHVIYETDDDNRPLDVLRNFLLTPTTSGLTYAGKDRFNPYRHFGQATLWPRGYPLGDVGEEPNSSYVLGQWKTPSIQQGLVNGDPDVDAIFRLTRKKTLQVLNVTFDGSAPLAILPRGVFSPFNSQNTLFLQDALWATLIPVTTTFRMCDIWRGYWAQRLLWEIGGTLAFLAPNAFQRRNPHSYMADAANEEDMYFQTQDLIAFLKRWQCNSSLTFFGCVERLSLDMADARFWGPRDAMLAETWVRDLRRINYTEPERVCRQPCVTGVAGSPLGKASEKQRGSRNEPPPVRSNGVADASGRNVRVHQGDAAGNASHEIQIAADKANARVQFWASDQEPPTIHKALTKDTTMWKHVDGIRKLCPNESIVLPPKIEPTPPLRRRQSDILLVVVFNSYHYDNIPTLHAMYSYHFPLILYCGNDTESFVNASRFFERPVSFVEASIKDGFLAYMCLHRAMKMNYYVKGYLLIGDDTLVNPWNIRGLDRERFWSHVLNPARRQQSVHWYWWNKNNGRHALTQVWNDLERRRTSHAANKSIAEFISMTNLNYRSMTNVTVQDGAFYGFADFVYIPDKFKLKAMFYLEILAAREVFLEVALPTLLAGLSPIRDIVTAEGNYLWSANRNRIQNVYNHDKVFLHPVKIPLLRSDSRLWREFFCQKYLASSLQ